MSQKTLHFFFSSSANKKSNQSDFSTKKSEPESEESKCSSMEDSPIKTTNNKKRHRISSSSSDESSKEDEKSGELFTNRSPAKKTYASKLAKFSASPKTENSKNNDVAKENENIEADKDVKKEVKTDKRVENPQKADDAKVEASDTKEDDVLSKQSPGVQKAVKDFFESASSKKKSPTGKPKSPKSKSKSPTPETSKTKSASKETKVSSDENTSNSGATYNPANPKYHPIDDACWKHGEKIPYYALARTFEEIENISARLKMIEILSNFLRSALVLSPDDFLACVYLSLNRIGPAHEGLELGLAEQTLIRAISQSTGRTFNQIKSEIQEVGDLGLVSERSRSSQRLMFQPAPLTVAGIFKKFREIATMSGQATVNKKISIIQTLYVACKGPEARFLIRSLNGKLRIGLAEQSVLQSIALACAMTPPGQEYPPSKINMSKGLSAESFKSQVDELALIVKTTYCECPNYDLIVPVLLKEGIEALPKHCKITPGLPLKPMLAQPTKGVQEVLTRFENMEFTCEWKYDGERAQIHYCNDGVVKIYSRNQEDNTSKYPDIISRLDSTKKEGVKSFILDCEAVAYDKKDNRILPFQILSTRKRKDANESEIKVQVCVFMFDLLYLNDEPLVKKKLKERRDLLRENFKEVHGEWMFATSIDTSKMEEVQEFLEESVKGNCEGLMVKTLEEEATYEIAKRSRNWLKLKKDYLEGVGDTLDVLVLGGYLGKGKRTGTYGGFLVACYDEESEEYQSVCRLGTGFSDEALTTHTEFFKPHIIKNAPAYYRYDAGLEPDHWFEPVQVWEIKCADLSLSPVHRAAIGILDPEKGISLRFPRFLRIRDDKKPEQATTARQIIEMYQNQEQVKNQQGKTTKFKEEDFY